MWRCLYIIQISPPLIKRDDISMVHETIVTEITMENETRFLHASIVHPDKIMNEPDNFCSELNLLLTNVNNNQTACSILIGDFNARCTKWCSSDKNIIASLEIDNITTTGLQVTDYSLQQATVK